MSDLGLMVKLVRAALDLSQKDMATLTGTSVNYLSLIEGNHREPSFEFIRKLSHELGVPMALFFLDVDRTRFLERPEYGTILIQLNTLILDIARLRERDALAKLAEKARKEYREGRTEELDPDNL